MLLNRFYDGFGIRPITLPLFLYTCRGKRQGSVSGICFGGHTCEVVFVMRL